MCSGGAASKAEQAAADATRKQELDLMQQQLQKQADQVSQVNAALDPIISAGGMSPEQQAALTSLVMNNLPATFSNVKGQINQDLVARGVTGGANAGSGDIARNFGQLGAMEASLQQQGLSQIQIQKQQQLMQALGAKMGIANLFGQNVSGFNQGGLSALGQGVSAARTVDTTGFNPLGAILGAGLSFATGGASSGGGGG